jgi:hypothetical protein
MTEEMTHDELCELLLRLGGKEYPDRTKSAGTRCFAIKLLVGAPVCACNDKPPSLHVNAYPDFRHPSTGQVFHGGVEFEIAGEAGDERWLKALIHSVKREEVEEILPSVEVAAFAVWCAFVDAMKSREHLSSRHQEGESK